MGKGKNKNKWIMVESRPLDHKKRKLFLMISWRYRYLLQYLKMGYLWQQFTNVCTPSFYLLTPDAKKVLYSTSGLFFQSYHYTYHYIALKKMTRSWIIYFYILLADATNFATPYYYRVYFLNFQKMLLNLYPSEFPAGSVQWQFSKI